MGSHLHAGRVRFGAFRPGIQRPSRSHTGTRGSGSPPAVPSCFRRRAANRESVIHPLSAREPALGWGYDGPARPGLLSFAACRAPAFQVPTATDATLIHASSRSTRRLRSDLRPTRHGTLPASEPLSRERARPTPLLRSLWLTRLSPYQLRRSGATPHSAVSPSMQKARQRLLPSRWASPIGPTSCRPYHPFHPFRPCHPCRRPEASGAPPREPR